MKKIGKEIASKPLWEDISRTYVDALETPYHKHRMEVISDLLPEQIFRQTAMVVDFGCGDAVLFPPFVSRGVNMLGIDISENMIDLGKQRLEKLDIDPGMLEVGGIEKLHGIKSESVDAVLCFNTLAYLTNSEEREFYNQANRILKKNGYLAVSHSNELFDLFSLNRFTAQFFADHLIEDKNKIGEIEDLLKFPEEPENYTTYNIRENPLSYRFKLNEYGFTEVKQLFSNLHHLPPLALRLTKPDKSFDFDSKEYPSTLQVAESDKWKLMFTCSTYMSLSQKASKPSFHEYASAKNI